MPKTASQPALIAHGGAGGRAPLAERRERRASLLAAVARGSAILGDGGSAIDAVTTAVALLEDDPLFNAGYGSVLTLDGRVEMDAAVMVAELDAEKRNPKSRRRPAATLRAGGVVLVSRVRNPILLARWVMEHTPHVLMGGAAAERLARRAGILSCRPQQLVTERARRRWLAMLQERAAASRPHGTVGAAALDRAGNLAAATSTGGVAEKMPGRIGDSAIIGAGLYAGPLGAASATGTGEAIMKTVLCREALALLVRLGVQTAAERGIAELYAATGGEAGLVMVDANGRFGYAHNAQAMEIALCVPPGEVRYLVLDAVVRGRARPLANPQECSN